MGDVDYMARKWATTLSLSRREYSLHLRCRSRCAQATVYHGLCHYWGVLLPESEHREVVEAFWTVSNILIHSLNWFLGLVGFLPSSPSLLSEVENPKPQIRST